MQLAKIVRDDFILTVYKRADAVFMVIDSPQTTAAASLTREHAQELSDALDQFLADADAKPARKTA